MMGLTALIVIFFLWGKWKDENLKFRISPLSVGVLFFTLSLTVSSIFGVDPINSFFGWGNVVPLVAIFALVIFSFILGSLIRNDSKVITRSLTALFFSGIMAMVFFYTGLPDPIGKIDGSTLGNSSYLGGFIMFALFSGLALFLYHKNIWKKVFTALGIIFLVVNPLFISKDFLIGKIGLLHIFKNPMQLFGIANGATLGIGLSVLFIIFLFMIFSQKKILKIIGLVLAISLLLGISFVSISLVDDGSKINKVFTEEKSENRFIAWDIAKRGFAEHPIIGVGHNNYIYNFGKYYNTDLYKESNTVERLIEPHNVVWEFASNTGILGLVGYLGLLVTLFITLCNMKENKDDRKIKAVRIILAGLLLGYFVQNLFVFDTINTYLALFVIVAIGLGLSKGKEWRLGQQYLIYRKAFIIIAMAGSLFVIKVFAIDPAIESKEMNKIMNETKNMADFAKTREGVYERSVFGNVMDYTLQTEKLFKLYQNNLYKVNSDNRGVFLAELRSSVSQLEEVMKKQPDYADAHLVISEILNLYLMVEMKDGDHIKLDGKSYSENIWNESFNSISRSIELNENNPQNYLVLSQLYMIKGDFDNAEFNSKKYITIAPEYKQGYDFARSLIRIYKDKEFEDFVNRMESKWMNR